MVFDDMSKRALSRKNHRPRTDKLILLQLIYMSWLQGVQGFFGTPKPKEDPLDSLKIYTDQQLTSHVRLQISRSTNAEDIINSMFSESDFSLVLVTEQANNVRVFRRVMSFEKILQQLEAKPSYILYHYLINDFSIKRHHRENRKPQEIQYDQNFEQVGRMQKKNKKGKYIETTAYLNSTHFGFLNVNKKKVKLFKLENLQLYIWDDDCEYSFKIVTLKKIYFFRTYRGDHFKHWLYHLERRLETTRHKFILLSQEKTILDCNICRQNMIEQSVKSMGQEQEDLEPFYEYVLGNCLCSSDMNLLKWALLAKKLQAQIVDEEVIRVLVHSWNQISKDYKDELYKERLQGHQEFVQRETSLRHQFEFHGFSDLFQEAEQLQGFWDQQSEAGNVGIISIYDQVFEIIKKKYFQQYQNIINLKRMITRPKNIFKHLFVETPNFSFFQN